MFKIVLAVALFLAANYLNLNQDCDGKTCQSVYTQTID